MNVRLIVFATDFSPASEAARRMALDMARQSGARLHLVHVVDALASPGEGAEQVRALAREMSEGIRIDTALLSGRVAGEIVRYARDNGADIIVLGTHGRTGVSRAILGSVAEAVIRTAPCPILTVPAAAPAPGPAPEAEVLAPRHCVVCALETEAEQLICQRCRARIRGEAPERKAHAERPGRRGTPL